MPSATSSAMQQDRLFLIQKAINEEQSRAPLVLIHDGGGTIFQYFLLGQLGRGVYGINNPRFDDKCGWPGGIPQMSQVYADMILEHIGHGPVTIGGWSLGGLLCLEVARLLQGHKQIQVTGIILIDTWCPWNEKAKAVRQSGVSPRFQGSTTTLNQEKVLRCFAETIKMIASWPRPPAFSAPPTVLLRASEPLSRARQTGSLQYDDGVDGILGWSGYGSLPIVSVVDVPGNHFTLFNSEYIDELTRSVNQACRHLERCIPLAPEEVKS